MVVIVMGAGGAGKTTVGRRLADRRGWPFLDADAFHSAANVARMAYGTPLTDADRRPWLDAIHAALADIMARGASAVLACSALKASYRTRLTAGLGDVRLVYLKADRALLRARLAARRNHFMPATLVDSQLADLEEPRDAIVVNAAEDVERIVDTIDRALR
jgi:gluconokinase